MKTSTRRHAKHRPVRRAHAPAKKRHAAARPAPVKEWPAEMDNPADVIAVDQREEELSDEEALDKMERQHLY